MNVLDHGSFPTPLTFNPEDPVHMDFILAAANLKAQVEQVSDHSKQGRGLPGEGGGASIVGSILAAKRPCEPYGL